MGKKNIKLFCVVCRREIPPERLLRHAPTTCGSKCQREVGHRRRALSKKTKCISCGTPSTPEERREFQAWRKARGDHKKRGRKPKYSIPDPRQLDIPGDVITVN